MSQESGSLSASSLDPYRGLKGWTKPGDVASLLMIMNGEIVQKAIAQLSGPRLVPVAFSFGWVVYSIQALLVVLGTGRLMPIPDWESIVINIDSGHSRANRSWILGRLLRDWDYKPKNKRGLCIVFLDAVRRENGAGGTEHDKLDAGLPDLPPDVDESADPGSSDAETGHRSGIGPRPLSFYFSLMKRSAAANTLNSNVSWSRVLWKSIKPRCLKVDRIWIFAWVMVIIQFVIAIVAAKQFKEVSTLIFTIVGTILALFCGSFQRWSEEKWCYREPVDKRICLTEGNGSQLVMVIRAEGIGWDFEFLAGGRVQRINCFSKSMVALQACLWLGLLVAIAREEGQTWLLMLIGSIGTFQNIVVAGAPRKPSAFGIYLKERDNTIRRETVRDALVDAEKEMKLLGQTLFPIFFPGTTNEDREAFNVDATGRPVVDVEVTQQDVMRPAEVVEATSSGREAAGVDGSHDTHSLPGGEQ